MTNKKYHGRQIFKQKMLLSWTAVWCDPYQYEGQHHHGKQNCRGVLRGGSAATEATSRTDAGKAESA